MKLHLVPLLALVAATTGCIGTVGWQTVRGSGNIVTEEREVTGFDRVAVSGSGVLTISQGAEESLTIEADDNLLAYIEAEVDGGRLEIGPREVNLRPTDTIQYRLKLREIRDLSLSGSLQAEAEELKTDRLTLRISGSGNIRIGHLETERLSSRVSGSGRIAAAGHAENQEIHISGSGDHLTSELRCSRADANISGSGHASLWVEQSLSANISGSGRVEYRGKPSVNSHVSGSGRVRRVADAQ